MQSFQSISWNGPQDEGWTGLLNLPGLPHEVVHLWWILPGPTPGKLIRQVVQTCTNSETKMPEDPWGGLWPCRAQGAILWISPGLSTPAQDLKINSFKCRELSSINKWPVLMRIDRTMEATKLLGQIKITTLLCIDHVWESSFPSNLHPTLGIQIPRGVLKPKSDTPNRDGT